jgi:hypothetical protein
VDDAQDLGESLEGGVELEAEVGQSSHLDAVAGFASDVAGGLAQGVEGDARLVVGVDGDLDAGVAQVGRDLDRGDADHARDARVVESAGEDVADGAEEGGFDLTDADVHAG